MLEELKSLKSFDSAFKFGKKNLNNICLGVAVVVVFFTLFPGGNNSGRRR